MRRKIEEDKEQGVMLMSPQDYNHRLNAIKVADAINKIESVPVSQYAKELSEKWARGEITGAQMKAALISIHKKEE